MKKYRNFYPKSVLKENVPAERNRSSLSIQLMRCGRHKYPTDSLATDLGGIYFRMNTRFVGLPNLNSFSDSTRWLTDCSFTNISLMVFPTSDLHPPSILMYLGNNSFPYVSLFAFFSDRIFSRSTEGNLWRKERIWVNSISHLVMELRTTFFAVFVSDTVPQMWPKQRLSLETSWGRFAGNW